MRIHLLSDVHTEFAPYESACPAADLVVLAGDIGVGVRGVKWAKTAFPGRPVVYVPGNHEYYGGAIPRITDKLRAEAEGSEVHILERDSVELCGLRFIGATLWTDLALHGPATIQRAAEWARDGLNDYRKIRRSPSYAKLRPEDTRKYHLLARDWLSRELRGAAGHPTVVVTHHAPSQRSLPASFANDELAPCYASHLDELVEASGALAWFHGHTHHCVDYQLGATRVVSNQRGYPEHPVAGFDPGFSLEL